MEGKVKASKFEEEDFISNMPDNVVTNIMDRIPLKDAIRTGILSKTWRFRWTMLRQLVFDKNFFDCFKDAKDKTDFGRIISRILLHITGVITKFVLSIDEGCYSATLEEDISHLILFLSRKGIKDLTLVKTDANLPFKLPARLFSCLELKHLKLARCCFYPPASFQGFPNLLSLDLFHVQLETGKFVRFFTECPLLKTLKMSCSSYSLTYENSKFVLSIDDVYYSPNLEKKFSHWIKFLSRKGIKHLTLWISDARFQFKLPVKLFSCLELKHLKLARCCFDPPASFDGFRNLLSLDLFHVKLEMGKFDMFLFRCHSLKILNMSCSSYSLTYENPKLVISIDEACYSATLEEDISKWISFLSLKAIKHFTLRNGRAELLFKLPFRFFYCLDKLKHMELAYCCFDPPSRFHGFPNLLSLDLFHIEFRRGEFAKFFTECPALEILKMNYSSDSLKYDKPDSYTKVTVAEIAKLANLKELSLLWCTLDNTDSISIFELLAFFPKLEKLCMSFFKCQELTRGLCSRELDYKTIVLPQLRRVEFTYLSGAKENEECLMECLLGCFPSLKEMILMFETSIEKPLKLEYIEMLLSLQRAYPEVIIRVR